VKLQLKIDLGRPAPSLKAAMVALGADFEARKMGTSWGYCAVTWPSVLLRPGAYQISAFAWLRAERPASIPQRLFTGQTPLAIEDIVAAGGAERVMFIFDWRLQLRAAMGIAAIVTNIAHSESS
jgi:hypothetical protein